MLLGARVRRRDPGVTEVSKTLDELMDSLQEARDRITGLRGLVAAADSDDELAAMLSTADRIRNRVIARAEAGAVWLSSDADPAIVVDVSDGADPVAGDAAIDHRIDELRALLGSLSPFEPAGPADRQDPPQDWGSGDVFAEVYR